MDANRLIGLFLIFPWELAGKSWLQGAKILIFPKYKYYTKTPRGVQNTQAITACRNVPRKKSLHLYSPEGTQLLARRELVGHGMAWHGTEDCCRALLCGAWKWLQVSVRVQPLGWLSTAQAAAFLPEQEPRGEWR